jgi:hypothetical protein
MTTSAIQNTQASMIFVILRGLFPRKDQQQQHRRLSGSGSVRQEMLGVNMKQNCIRH